MQYEPQSIFVSQQEQGLHSESGCGIASLLMLLKYINHTPLPTWQTLCSELKLSVLPVKKGYSEHDPEIRLYPEDIFRYVIKENFLFRMHFFDNEWRDCLAKGTNHGTTTWGATEIPK